MNFGWVAKLFGCFGVISTIVSAISFVISFKDQKIILTPLKVWV